MYNGCLERKCDYMRNSTSDTDRFDLSLRGFTYEITEC